MKADKDNPIPEIKEYYKKKSDKGTYATSPDYNLREVEINCLLKWLSNGKKVLDVGCGNGYSTIRFAEKYTSDFIGIDFVDDMVSAARGMTGKHNIIGKIEFRVGDVTNIGFDDDTFDVVVSERCLLNLPSREMQWKAMSEISRVLKTGGIYLMLEGTLQGLGKMNEIRNKFGLDPIPEAEKSYNWFSNKFDEPEMIAKSSEYFSELISIERFGMYFFLSRVVHPLLVRPEQPEYDAKINEVAREIGKVFQDFEGMGHEALFIFKK